MADRLIPRAWWMRTAFVLIAGVILFGALLPLGAGAGRMPGPDILTALAFAWVLRRPDYVPVWILAAVLFVADIVTMRPPGLWAALTVLGIETARSRTGTWADMPFLLELTVVGLILTAVTVANAALSAIFFVDQPPLHHTVIRLFATMCFYPLVVLITDSVFRIKRASDTAQGRRVPA